ncbi:hypothetical protein JCM33374_g2454 [Metschnikowia sp. JCM 33374]|nr:hypothetical protein JCM33374_g2454 [Metschnikowia sp. JCM 33374]
MKFFHNSILACAACVGIARAYAVTGGTVAINKAPVAEINPNGLNPETVVLNSPTDTVSFSVALENPSKTQPHQLMFILSDSNGLDHAVFAKYKSGNAQADISVAKIPAALKKGGPIHVSVIAANGDHTEANVEFPVVQLVASDALQSLTSHAKPARLGALAEIHHSFKTDPTTVASIVPVVFSGIAVVLLVVLLGAWTSVLKNELFASPQASTWKAALLSTLAYFEYTFFQYYLGASIFTTIFHAVLVAGPFLFFGSRALTALGKSRAEHKA